MNNVSIHTEKYGIFASLRSLPAATSSEHGELEIALANWVDGLYITHNPLCAKYINGELVRVKIREVRWQNIEFCLLNSICHEINL